MAAKKKRTYSEIMKAKEALGLPSFVTAAAVKKRHRELVKEFHPDTCGMAHDANEARIREINEAYSIISDYLAGYRHSFSRNAVARYNPEEGSPFAVQQDPHWGRKG